MQTSSMLNVAGLIVSTLAAALMYYFPPRLSQYTEKGEPISVWVANPTDEGKRIGPVQGRLAKAAPALLAFGFFLQLWAAILAS